MTALEFDLEVEQQVFGASKYTSVMPTPASNAGVFAFGNEWKFLVAGRIMGARAKASVTTPFKLYTSAGALVATSPNMATVGAYQEALFATPIVFNANDQFIACYDEPVTYWSLSGSATNANVSSNLSEVTWLAGRYGTTGTFPNNVAAPTFYSVDLIYQVGTATTPGSANLSNTDEYNLGKSSALSIADIERVDFAGAANRSIADLASLAIAKPSTRSMADAYFAKIAGADRSLADKASLTASNTKTYSDVMFLPGA